MLQGIDHVAIAVPSVDAALPRWTTVLGFDLVAVEVVPTQQVRVAILQKGPHRIELMEPTTADSPVGRFLAKRGPGIHHLCLRVEGLSGMLLEIQGAGLPLINEVPVAGAHGCQVAFLHPKGLDGVLLELSEPGESADL